MNAPLYRRVGLANTVKSAAINEGEPGSVQGSGALKPADGTFPQKKSPLGVL